jgi:hypothetical protein
MDKQQASAAIAALLKEAEQKVSEAKSLADKYDLAFRAHIGPVHNDYVSRGYNKDYEKAQKDAENFDWDAYDIVPEFGGGWQSSSC